MPRQNSFSATCTSTPTTQFSKKTWLQYTEKGIQPTSPPPSASADPGYVPSVKASATYARPGTKSKKKEEDELADTFPASGITNTANKLPQSRTFPNFDNASTATDAWVWKPIGRKVQVVSDCVEKSGRSPEDTDKTGSSAMSASKVTSDQHRYFPGLGLSMSDEEETVWKEFCNVTSGAS